MHSGRTFWQNSFLDWRKGPGFFSVGRCPWEGMTDVAADSLKFSDVLWKPVETQAGKNGRKTEQAYKRRLKVTRYTREALTAAWGEHTEKACWLLVRRRTPLQVKPIGLETLWTSCSFLQQTPRRPMYVWLNNFKELCQWLHCLPFF